IPVPTSRRSSSCTAPDRWTSNPWLPAPTRSRRSTTATPTCTRAPISVAYLSIRPPRDLSPEQVVTSRRLAGKVALVPGAARGRGRSHALRLAWEGADVMLVDLCDNIPSCDYPLATSEDLDRTAIMIEKLDRKALMYRCDVCDRTEMESAVDTAVRQLGALDVVVANATIAPTQPDAPIAAFIDPFDGSMRARGN